MKFLRIILALSENGVRELEGIGLAVGRLHEGGCDQAVVSGPKSALCGSTCVDDDIAATIIKSRWRCPLKWAELLYYYRHANFLRAKFGAHEKAGVSGSSSFLI